MRAKRERGSIRGMHTAEYAICFGLVIAAAAGMQTYVKRALQARIKTATDAVATATADKTVVTISTTGPAGGGVKALSMTGLKQYEPYYEHGDQTSARAALTNETHSEGDEAPFRSEQSRQTRKAGSEQGEGGADRLPADDAWEKREKEK